MYFSLLIIYTRLDTIHVLSWSFWSLVDQWLCTHNTDPKTNMQLTSKMVRPLKVSWCSVVKRLRTRSRAHARTNTHTNTFFDNGRAECRHTLHINRSQHAYSYESVYVYIWVGMCTHSYDKRFICVHMKCSRHVTHLFYLSRSSFRTTASAQP
jgi:hypothetical protein